MVGRTWQLTLDVFEARGLPEAVALLRLLARLAPGPLPLSVLNHAEIGAVLPRGRAETALRALLDHSLAQLSDLGSRCVHCHGVLLDSVAAATPAAEVAELNATAARLLGAAVPAVPDAGPYDPGLRLLAPHTLALLRRVTEPGSAADAARATQVADVLEVATRLAVALHRTGDYLSGWETVRVAADLAERTLGADHRAVLAARTGSAGHSSGWAGIPRPKRCSPVSTPCSSGFSARPTRTHWTARTRSSSFSATWARPAARRR